VVVAAIACEVVHDCDVFELPSVSGRSVVKPDSPSAKNASWKVQVLTVDA
jgi:hypothetical protein